jgi:hypothetical protein
MIFDKRILSLLIIAPLGVGATSHGGGDIGRFLKEHQATFTRMHEAKLLNKIPASPEDLRNLAEDGTAMGGCTRVKDGSRTQTVCIGGGGEIASCLVEDGFCEHSIIDFNAILNSDEVGAGLMDFFENGSNPFLCQTCTNNEPDCTNLASTFDVNACTADADFSVECDENTQCCNLGATFEGEEITLNCCMEESGANALDSRCCASYKGEEFCSGLKVSCPEGATADDVEQCTCSVTFNGQTCQGCNLCPSKPDALGVVADGGFEYVCDNVVPNWSQNCDEASSIGIGEQETFFTGTEIFRAISVFPPEDAQARSYGGYGDSTSSSWHVRPTHPLTIFLAATAAGLYAFV